MQLPWKVNINKEDIILEVGPGAYPYYRSDVYIDKFDPNEDVALEQFGGKRLENSKNIPHYVTKDGTFAFKDKAFNYVICSHVLEHVPQSQIDLLMNEMQRVSKRGYIEFPSIFFESIYNYDVHLNILDYFENTIYLLDKEDTNFNMIKPFTDVMIKSRKLWKGFEKINRPLMAVGFEWNDKIPEIKIVNQEEFLEMINKKYFDNVERIEAYDYNWFQKKLFRLKEKMYKHSKLDIKRIEK
ncbi:MAG: methyltransferase domain-containing protein [Campylobacterota bacterium]|nr:methyltransferase domain-containing protein [Campylobacterota bacterium]